MHIQGRSHVLDSIPVTLEKDMSQDTAPIKNVTTEVLYQEYITKRIFLKRIARYKSLNDLN